MKMRWAWVIGVAVAVAAAGCSKKEEPVSKAPTPAPAPAAQPQMPPSHPPAGGQEAQPGMGMGVPTKREIVVPDEVRDAWKAVVLQVGDKATGKTEDVTIDIGQSATVNGLEIKVEHFLPTFSMGGGSFTSASNETQNPAAKVVIREDGQDVFSSFLFSMHPDVHPFQSEKYTVILKDFVKK